MIKEIVLNGTKIKYELQYKRVKNINLRIRRDGSVYVSASKKVPQELIERFLVSKTDFILKALNGKSENIPKVRYFGEEEVRTVIISICEKAYPYYERLGIEYPQIKFRKMVSRWGSCHPGKGVLTFNTNLMYTPAECIEYVVLHEFTHFLQANHSKEFYAELEKVCPDWKNRRSRLKYINIR